MTRAEQFLRRLRADRPRELSADVLARVDKIAKDKKKSIEFLQKGGFLDERGKLAAKYRRNSR
jgi:hypothetical protein